MDGEFVAAEVTEAPAEEAAVDVPVVEAEPETPEQAETKARAARLALYEEKLVASREKRQAQRIAERAKAERRAALDERRQAAEFAAAEKAKYQGLGTVGKIKETAAALGLNPRDFADAVNREAIEYSTPEAAAKREQARIDAQFAEQKAEIEALRKERADAIEAERAHAHQSNLVTHFQAAAADPAFKNLRIEYPDEALLDHAQYYDKNPRELHKHAREFGVRLTQPEKGFTMHELLQVLSAAQAAHDAGKQARQAANAPPGEQSGKAPTVNGTAERRNAGTVTNELATQRASPGPKVSGSIKERLQRSIDEEIRRSSGS